MRDPREDPRPGDAIEIAKGWVRLVTGRDFAEMVTYDEKYPRRHSSGPVTIPIEQWRSDAKDRFVISRAAKV